MKRIVNFATAAAVAFFSGGAAHADGGGSGKAGYDRFDIDVPHLSRPLDMAVWYPAEPGGHPALVGDNAVFIGHLVRQGARPLTGKRPLVLLSHGSGGNAQNMGWLTSALVKEGALVLAVNHPGSTTGNASPGRAMRHWTRPWDLSAALDSVLAHPKFGPLVDRERISALGFSLGGMTVLSLGGAQADLGRYLDYCQEYGTLAMDCIYFESGGDRIRDLPRQAFSQGLKDLRISRVLAVDPGLGYAITDDSLRNMALPVGILNLGIGKNRLFAADSSADGNGLAVKLRNVTYHVVAPANHFTFLENCKEQGPILLEEEGEDPICSDPEGTDRRRAHKKMARWITNFLFGRTGT